MKKKGAYIKVKFIGFKVIKGKWYAIYKDKNGKTYPQFLPQYSK